MSTAPGSAVRRLSIHGRRSNRGTPHTLFSASWSTSSSPRPAQIDTRTEPTITHQLPRTVVALELISSPMTGTAARVDSIRSSRSSGLFANSSPTTFTNANKSGKMEKNPR